MNRRPNPPKIPRVAQEAQGGPDELTACTRALASKLDRELSGRESAGSTVVPKIPDFTDVLRRAATLEPGQPLHVAQSGATPEDGPADVFEQASRGEIPALDAELAAFVRARRGQLEPQLQQRAAMLVAEGWRGANPAPGTGSVATRSRHAPVHGLREGGANWARRVAFAIADRPALATGIALAAALIMVVSVGVGLAGDRSFADMLSVGSSSSLAANEAELVGTQGRARLRSGRPQGNGSRVRGSSAQRLDASAEEGAGAQPAVSDESIEPHGLLNQAKGIEVQLGTHGQLSGPSTSAAAATISHRRHVGAPAGRGADDSANEGRGRPRSQAANRARQRRNRRPRHTQASEAGLEARMLKLEAEARRAWRAGRLQRASSLYEKLIARAGRRPVAERAFGDLFAIQRRLSGRRAQLTLWRRYLKRFPRGLYAADARAGLCGAQPQIEAGRCWREYLDAHPRGPHVGRARKQLESSDAVAGE